VPRFYFDIRDNDKLTRDEDGVELDGVDAARREAAQTVAQMGKDVLPGTVHWELAIEVRNDRPEPLLRAALVFDIQRLR
jgi:hypothetical protein